MTRALKAGQTPRQRVAIFSRTFPIVLGVLALASLATAALPAVSLSEVLPIEGLFGPLFGAAVGRTAGARAGGRVRGQRRRRAPAGALKAGALSWHTGW